MLKAWLDLSEDQVDEQSESPLLESADTIQLGRLWQTKTDVPLCQNLLVCFV